MLVGWGGWKISMCRCLQRLCRCAGSPAPSCRVASYHFHLPAPPFPMQCGMVPVGARFAHGFNPHNTGLGLPCPQEVAAGWVDMTESLP